MLLVKLMKTKCISFNIWDKSQKMEWKDVEDRKIKSDKEYSCIIFLLKVHVLSMEKR